MHSLSLTSSKRERNRACAVFLAAKLFFLLLLSQSVHARSYSIEYHVQLIPDQDLAKVRIELKNTKLVKLFDFNLSKSECYGFTSDSKLEQKQQRLQWQPRGRNATLEYQCPITHRRPSSKGHIQYDARMTEHWALFRGDDLVPPARVRALKAAESKAILVFDLPQKWSAVNTEWERDKTRAPTGTHKNAPVFYVDNPQRSFDRPTGWMIAGKLGTRRALIGEGDNSTRISVSAPLQSSLRRMDILTFLQFVWPEFQQTFIQVPEKLLIVGGDDPMWRGGLSAGNSFYVHSDRPIISENGTSTLIHEMFHMVTGIRGKKNSDWIAEGLAEYYSITFIRRAGGMGDERYQAVLEGLQQWSSSVKTLQVSRSKGAVTAAATLLFKELDEELQQKTQQKKNLDAIVRILLKKGKVDTEDLAHAFKQLCGEESEVLKSPLLLARQLKKSS